MIVIELRYFLSCVTNEKRANVQVPRMYSTGTTSPEWLNGGMGGRQFENFGTGVPKTLQKIQLISGVSRRVIARARILSVFIRILAH